MATFERLAFYRGMSEKYATDRITLVTTRKDRRPKDTETVMHQAADDWFNEKFGFRFRSQALFVSSSVGTAEAYGATKEHVFRVVPLGDYTFCWSQSCKDMLGLTYDCAKPADCIPKLNNANYMMDDLISAHKSGHEVMLYCERYLAIPRALLGAEKLQSNDSAIILL